MTKTLVVRLFLSLAAGLGVAVAAALTLAVADLYLTGHGRPSLTRPFVDRPSIGIHLSRADLVVLAAGGLSTSVVWWVTGVARRH